MRTEGDPTRTQRVPPGRGIKPPVSSPVPEDKALAPQASHIGPSISQRHVAKDTRLNLKALKRPYDSKDISSFQKIMQAHAELCKQRQRKMALKPSTIYRHLTNSDRKASRKGELPTEESKQSLEALIVRGFNFWRKNILGNEALMSQRDPKYKDIIPVLKKFGEAKTTQDLRSLYARHPEINQSSALVYQDGQKYSGSGFLHFDLPRLTAYGIKRSPETKYRLYLNPSSSALPALADKFVKKALERQLPLKFKIIDFSDPKTDRDCLHRKDNFIIYLAEEELQGALDILEEIRAEKPAAFSSDHQPSFTMKVSGGIYLGEHPDEYQRAVIANGDGKTSFTEVRANFLHSLWMETTGNLIMRNPDLKIDTPNGSRSLKEILLDELKDQLDSHFKSRKNDIGKWMERFSKSGNIKHTMHGNESDKDGFVDAFAKSMEVCMWKVLPHVEPAVLERIVRVLVPKYSKKFGINPQNMALCSV